MTVTLSSLMKIGIQGALFSYSDTQAMLYALGVGLGRDPMDEGELPFVYEGSGLRTVPTLATVLTQFDALRSSGIDYTQVLHAEQGLVMHRPLPAAADLLADYSVVGVVDKGSAKGVFIYTETQVRTAADDVPLYTARGTIIARGDGGIGGSGVVPSAVQPIPDRDPDHAVSSETRADQALLYRLNGDRNPLHADPANASVAGFVRPILHGLCTYGIACRAILMSVCDGDHRRIGQFDVRFSAPVYPGETLLTEIWLDDDAVAFRCRVPDRDIIAISNGFCKLLPVSC